MGRKRTTQSANIRVCINESDSDSRTEFTKARKEHKYNVARESVANGMKTPEFRMFMSLLI
jgi:hypothetical protein